MMRFSKICALLLCFLLLLTSCSQTEVPKGNDFSSESESSSSVEESVAKKVESEKTEIPADLKEEKNSLEITVSEGTENCYAFGNQVLTFSGITEKTVCSLCGEFDGQIIVDTGDIPFELELCGVTLYSAQASPIIITSTDKVTICAKKETKNYIYDTRETVDTEDENFHSASIFATCDLDIEGKGELTVISSSYNGIHTKKDLEIKNLSLSVTCTDNALKGNDSVTIESGALTLIATAGDGIKTSNSDCSSKGKQRGTVLISGGETSIYCACDGICSAYDVEVSNEAILTIYTDRYSPYSESVENADSTEHRYIRFTSNKYSYSVKYYNSDTDYLWVNATYYKSVSGGFSTYYYYAFEKRTDYNSVQIFIYSEGQAQGQEDDCFVASDYMTWNSAYDTFALEARNSSLYYNWTNYSSSAGTGGMGGPGGMGGGPGGMQEGNSDKGDYSTKGIKADNEIRILGGTLTIQSYDDALHANGGETLENGNTSLGNCIVSGGTLSLFSKDDGIHADGSLTVSGGKIDVTNSYEGLEGQTISISGGEISVVSSDDGFNATATTGVGISFTGGTTNVFAGGDGLDANSRTSYQGILFNGGTVTVVSTSSNNSSLDTEQGYTYQSGSVLAVCPSNGMGSESTNCQNFSSVGKKTTMSLSNGKTLSVKVGGNTVCSVTMKTSLSALVIYLGSNSASFSCN